MKNSIGNAIVVTLGAISLGGIVLSFWGAATWDSNLVAVSGAALAVAPFIVGHLWAAASARP